MKTWLSLTFILIILLSGCNRSQIDDCCTPIDTYNIEHKGEPLAIIPNQIELEVGKSERIGIVVYNDNKSSKEFSLTATSKDDTLRCYFSDNNKSSIDLGILNAEDKKSTYLIVEVLEKSNTSIGICNIKNENLIEPLIINIK
jgi:hypothetical protein